MTDAEKLASIRRPAPRASAAHERVEDVRSASPSRRTQLAGAACSLGAGALVASMVHAHPEGLHAPAWVAYTAAGTFVLAGASVGTAALGAARLSRWLGVGVIGGLFSVTAWIAFGPGARECSMSFGVFRNLATDAVCRTAFGVGTLLLALVLALVLRRLALAPRGSPESA